jgi:3-dehydro-L-gulonate 2-dehydrogenase
VDELIKDIHSSEPVKEGTKIRYPGENVINTRKDNLENGIPVIEEKWNEVLGL